MYLGIDCGTQGTKVVILDLEQGQICGEGYAPHELISAANGRREQRVEWWTDAFQQAYREALDRSGIDSRAIRAIGVSGQQHGMVLLDAQGDVIRPAKLWCDTESATQNAELLEQLGGVSGSIERLGLVVATGYTLSKLLWLKQHEPEQFARIATILLPHDYLNYWFTGEIVAECGDASGTGYFDIRTRQWVPEVLALIDAEGRLERALPPLITAEQAVGQVRPEIARLLGLSEGVIVSSGGGDNMMGAIGTGNIQDGIVTLSLGTSGALYASSGRAPEQMHPLVAPFCSSSNGWLPLICTMNLTGVVNQVRQLFDYDLERFNRAASQAGIGAGGVTMLPFLNGERVPALPAATGSFLGLGMQNLTPANLCRAAMEGTTFGLRYGLELLQAAGISSREIRLIGGGAKSALWRQMVADVMDTDVVCPVVGEGAALGAAIQAAWCEQSARNGSIALADLCDRVVALDHSTAVAPEASAVADYREAYLAYRKNLSQLYPNAG
ncbi:xylulokinase [Marinobacterium zhoushanense]|uniref:Xylulose kinase n=1 Tax=Marinobacterium zhoushanense TaxID=1679163 RepID=A0ABQ1KFH5_9GAMM|nr:xylulokinase [Marinobacterium zhoushanense]GGB94170.1 xylulokinase [Marinobacterium zhoushanense]